jgi:hypothetical protein
MRMRRQQADRSDEGGQMTDDELVEELAGMLERIVANYERETSGPGSRFEGQRLEVVQARAVLRRVRQIAATGTEG